MGETYSMSVYTDGQKRSWERDGYFIAEDAVDPAMVPELRDAARRVKQKIRDGKLDLYTDWNSEGETHHFGGLLSPKCGERIFAEYMGSKPLLDYVFAQLGTDLRLGSCTIFTNPHDKPFICPWHRDDGLRYHQEEEPELEYLRQPRKFFRWELALMDDYSLHLVYISKDNGHYSS